MLSCGPGCNNIIIIISVVTYAMLPIEKVTLHGHMSDLLQLRILIDLKL